MLRVWKFAAPLTSLQDSKYQAISMDELKVDYEEIFANDLNVSIEEAAYLGNQHACNHIHCFGFEQRTGHITASLFQRVTHTSVDCPLSPW